LDKNEGIYVRNVKSGEVRSITGVNYMLDANEQYWNKSLSPEMVKIIYG
jgi:major vault protein